MLKDIVIAFQAYFQAHHFITRHRLWKWILIPGIIYAALFSVGGYFFLKNSTHAIDYLFSETGVKQWMKTAQNNWLNFFIVLVQEFVYMMVILFYFSLFKYFILVTGAPLFSYLSEKTEAILENKVEPFSISLLASDIKRGITQAARNALWQTVYITALLLLAFIPVVGCIAPLIALMTEFYYLGFSMIDYNCARGGLAASQSAVFIGRRKGLAIGNGIIFYLMHLVPVAGWILAPSYAVIAATLSMYNVKDV